MSAFELSRICGQGWNTAKKLLASGKLGVDAPQAAARDPHCGAVERSHWMHGSSPQAGRTIHCAGRKYMASVIRQANSCREMSARLSR